MLIGECANFLGLAKDCRFLIKKTFLFSVKVMVK